MTRSWWATGFGFGHFQTLELRFAFFNSEACVGWKPLQRSRLPVHKPPPCSWILRTRLGSQEVHAHPFGSGFSSSSSPLLFVSHWALFKPFAALNRQQPTGQVDRWLDKNDDEDDDNGHFKWHFNEISGSLLQRIIRTAPSVSMLAHFSSCHVILTINICVY